MLYAVKKKVEQKGKTGPYQNKWGAQGGILVHGPTQEVWWPGLNGRRKSGWVGPWQKPKRGSLAGWSLQHQQTPLN